jgi:hypothetical protein
MLTPREKPERHEHARAGRGRATGVSEREDCGDSPERGCAVAARRADCVGRAKRHKVAPGRRLAEDGLFSQNGPCVLSRRYFGARTQANYVATRCARESSACCGVNLAGYTERGAVFGGGWFHLRTGGLRRAEWLAEAWRANRAAESTSRIFQEWFRGAFEALMISLQQVPGVFSGFPAD